MSKHLLKLALATAGLMFCATAAEAACAYASAAGNNWAIYNGCSRPVTAAFKGSNGWTGGTGNISPGQRSVTAISTRYGIRMNFCYSSDWNAGRCRLNYY